MKPLLMLPSKSYYKIEMVRAIDSGPKRRSCGTETVINVTILVPGPKQSRTECP